MCVDMPVGDACVFVCTSVYKHVQNSSKPHASFLRYSTPSFLKQDLSLNLTSLIWQDWQSAIPKALPCLPLALGLQALAADLTSSMCPGDRTQHPTLVQSPLP